MADSTPNSGVPLLDLAPRLKRPLSLWNPLDYLRLLHWCFFFPQALPWYVEKFGQVQPALDEPRDDSGAIRRLLNRIPRDPINLHLWLQGFVVQIVVPVFVVYIAELLGLRVYWINVAAAVASGVSASIGFGEAYGVGRGVAVGVAFAVVLGVALGVGSDVVASSAAIDVGRGVIAGGAAFGFALGVAYGVAGGVALGVAFGVARGVALGVAFGVALGVAFGVALGVAFGVALGVAFIASILRLVDYALLAFPNRWLWRASSSGTYDQRTQPLSRLTPVPLPGIFQAHYAWLRQDPERGLDNINQVLRFSLQFAPCVRAANRWLSELSTDSLLKNVNLMARAPFDWALLRYASASLRTGVLDQAFAGISWLPKAASKRLRARLAGPNVLRRDTPAHAACAGYYAWHIENTAMAERAFAVVRELPHGQLLHQSAHALHKATQIQDINSKEAPEVVAAMIDQRLSEIAAWAEATAWLDTIHEQPLRPEAFATLRRLRAIASEAQVAVHSASRTNRSAALGRASGALTQLIDDVSHTCPYPEHPIVKKSAIVWREVITLAAGVAGQQVIAKPVDNPFIAGNPVSDRLFVGREEVFRRLEELWGSAHGQRASSVVLYGHRRMGKTSILHNLGQRFGARTCVAQCNLQLLGRVTSTGKLLYYFAICAYDAIVQRGWHASTNLREPAFEDFDSAHANFAFAKFLRALRATMTASEGGRRLILAIDEFERIEDAIVDGRVDADVLDMLRGAIQTEPWLIVVLAGLHTLQEMTERYWNPLFGSITPVKVSFLSASATAELLANPSDEFLLDFDYATAQRAYEHTHGQAYLTQLLGHTLVQRYNRQMFEERAPRPPRFTPEDVDAVIASPELYEQGNYYFSGVWSQAAESGPAGQVAVLRALAQADGPMADAALDAASGLAPHELRASLELLQRHDVVHATDAGCDFTVPLMRRWVRANKL